MMGMKIAQSLVMQ